MSLKENITKAKDNLFEDLDVSNSSEKYIKAKIALKINTIMASKPLTQQQIAIQLGLTQNKISNLRRGKLHGFSLSKLLEILTHLDRDVEIIIKPKSHVNKKGIIHLVG